MTSLLCSAKGTTETPRSKVSKHKKYEATSTRVTQARSEAVRPQELQRAERHQLKGSGTTYNRQARSKAVHLCCTAHKKSCFFLPNLRSHRQLEPPLPLNFACRLFRHSALQQLRTFLLIHALARQIWAPWCTRVSEA